jgi:hypothetical protein
MGRCRAAERSDSTTSRETKPATGEATLATLAMTRVGNMLSPDTVAAAVADTARVWFKARV